MKPEVILITPKLAKEWLEFNTDNRRLPVGNMEYYKRLIQSGEFILTHQGLAFTGNPSSPGRLLDGQTRLTAIMETGTACHQWVFWGCPEEIFGVLDGGKQRTFADHHGWEGDRISVMNILFWIAVGSRKITKTEADKINAQFGTEFEYLMEVAPSNKRKISMSSVKAAILVCMKQYPKEATKIASFYRAMVLSDYGNMPRVIQRLHERLLLIQGGGRDAMNIQVPMTYKAMSPQNWQASKLVCDKPTEVNRAIGNYIAAVCGL